LWGNGGEQPGSGAGRGSFHAWKVQVDCFFLLSEFSQFFSKLQQSSIIIGGRPFLFPPHALPRLCLQFPPCLFVSALTLGERNVRIIPVSPFLFFSFSFPSYILSKTDKKRRREEERERELSFSPPFFILAFFFLLRLGITTSDGQKSRANKQTRVELY
jgi:hypothetical protein